MPAQSEMLIGSIANQLPEHACGSESINADTFIFGFGEQAATEMPGGIGITAVGPSSSIILMIWNSVLS